MQSNYSNEASGNASYQIQPPIKHKESERDLIVHHLSDKNISLNCKNFDCADVRRIQHHLLPSLHKDQIDSMVIHGCTNDISYNKLHTKK